MTKLISLLLMASPAFAGWAIIDHTTGMASSNANAGTTLTINSTGATFLAAAVPAFGQSAAGVTISDSNGNTWHSRTNGVFGNTNVAIWYAYDSAGSSLIVGPSHSFSFSCTGCASGLQVFALSGNTPGIDPYDGTETGATSASSSVTVSPITPSQNNELILSAFVDVTSGSPFFSVSSPFTKFLNINNNTVAYSFAYSIQTMAMPVGPTWTDFNGGANLVSAVAAFRAAPPPGPSNNTVMSGISSAGVGH